MISVVVSTLGAPFLIDSLKTLKYPPDEVLVVVDMLGRTASTLDQDYPLKELFADLEQFSFARWILKFSDRTNWAVMNGCYNTGWRAARNDLIMFTHDDIEYEDYDYFTRASEIFQKTQSVVSRTEYYLAGVVIPEWEVINEVRVPNFPEGTWCLTQCVSPVSQIVHRNVIGPRRMDGFDEVDGIWYDGHLQAEARKHGWWFVHTPMPPIKHISNRSYRLNNWGGGAWALNPKWGNYQENFTKRYGHDFVRDIGTLSSAKILDPIA